MSEAFERLSPAMQYQIVNGLGFQDLRPVQQNAIAPILDGENCVVLAPTAGGKTEAAFFPLLSRMDSDDWRPVSVLYVAPIVALLNNQEERLRHYAGLIGRRAFKWHGGVSPTTRDRFCKDPTDILLITPESLEVMLMSKAVPAKRLFANLQAAVIDEIHAFVGDDRGGHLSAILERLSRYCGRDVQRIGLSATVGNPDDILAWVAGSSRREGRVLHPTGTSKQPELTLDYVANLENAATVIARLHPGEKRLVFVDSRRRVEALGRALRDGGVDSYVTHSSLSKDQRKLAEEAFAERQNCVIVATSALELGIDIGDLDRVVQIDAPSTVASFLQRMGRTGRRDNTSPNCTFLATDDAPLIQAAALLRLHARGYVESVPIHRRAAHLLAHQIMALSIQEDGISMADYWAWLSAATPFSDISDDERRELVEHMLAEDILHLAGGRLGLGTRGQRLYGAKNFLELYAVFSAPQTLRVIYGREEIGSIDAYFVQQENIENLTITLGAKTWRAKSLDWRRGTVQVEPSERGGLARWQGQPLLLHHDLCQAIREVLAGDSADDAWSRRAAEQIDGIRRGYDFLHDDTEEPLVEDTDGYRLWTFAGGKRNNLRARVLESVLGGRVTNNNLYIAFRDRAAESAVRIKEALVELQETGRPNWADALRFAESCARGRISKFQPCLTDGLEGAFLADELTELVSVRAPDNERLA